MKYKVETHGAFGVATQVFDSLEDALSVYNHCQPLAGKVKLLEMPQWISVEDRLPENEDIVNVKYEAGVFGYGFYGIDTGEWYYDTDEDITMDAVAYWQPLLQPRREKNARIDN